jgi:hypothetical protein
MVVGAGVEVPMTIGGGRRGIGRKQLIDLLQLCEFGISSKCNSQVSAFESYSTAAHCTFWSHNKAQSNAVPIIFNFSIVPSPEPQSMARQQVLPSSRYALFVVRTSSARA